MNNVIDTSVPTLTLTTIQIRNQIETNPQPHIQSGLEAATLRYRVVFVLFAITEILQQKGRDVIVFLCQQIEKAQFETAYNQFIISSRRSRRH